MLVVVSAACMLGTGRASAQAEGRIMIRRGTYSGAHRSDASAMFTNGSWWGTPVHVDGRCTVYRPRQRERLSAGMISIYGTARPLLLEESRDATGVNYAVRGAVPDPVFADGATIKVVTIGGANIPAFTATVTAPPELTGYSPPTSLSRNGTTLTWTPNAGTEVMIVIAALGTRLTGGALIVCRVPDTGSFAVPESTFVHVPTSFERAEILIARVSGVVQNVGESHVMVDVMSSELTDPVPFVARQGDAATHASPEVGRSDSHETSPSVFLGLSFGVGGVSRNGAAPPTAGTSYRFQLGQRLAHGLHLVEEISSIGSNYLTSSPTMTVESQFSLAAGVRWTPFVPRPARAHPSFLPGLYIDVHAFYATAVIGANLRDRITQTASSDSAEQTAWSPMASLAIGLPEFQGRDWSLGPEFREQLAYYDGHIQRGWMLLVAAHLN